jgi:L-lactate permease
MGFLEALREQRWADHRYYHHSRINQTLHLVSALSFLTAYVLVVFAPAVAALVGGLVSMTTRQAGHFFFEPKGYDHTNHATHEHKEDIKVGYNLQRKIVLLTIWALSPLVLLVEPTLFGLFEPATGVADFVRQTVKVWLAIGLGGLIARTIQLFFIRDVQTGLVWATKILTDPFHDIKLYYKAPLYLLRGELIDPNHGKHRPGEDEADDEEEVALRPL